MHAALAELDRLCQARSGEWLIGNRMTQADITVTCVYTFLADALAINRASVAYPALATIAERCEVLPEFRSVQGRLVSAPASMADRRGYPTARLSIGPS